jgi:hypothetical protein
VGVLLDFEVVGSEKELGKRSVSVDFQERDLEMLLYINEMGWTNAEVLCLRFFCEGPGSFNESRFKTARRRLWRLKKSGFLRSFRLGKGESFYLATPKTMPILQANFPKLIHLKPIQHVSFSQNDHMKRVHYSRLSLEYSGQSKGWRSERRLKMSDIEMQKEAFKGKYQPYLPDGIFLNQDKKKVVFEYENAQKTQKQMDKKIEQIERLLEYFPNNYEQVLVVATTDLQVSHYREKLLNKEKYQVMSFDYLLKQGGLHGISKHG